MKRLGLQFVDLLLYGDFWIAACATALVWQSQTILVGAPQPTPLVPFVFFSTVFVYALHRSIGLRKMAAYTERGRYHVIARFRYHIRLYAFIGAVAAAYFFWLMPAMLRWWIVLPGAASIGYVLPVPGLRGRRLRDLPGLKIFLVAGSFAWVSVVLPAVEQGLAGQWLVWAMAAERFLFVFALTVPFDVRDLHIDVPAAVKTLPQLLGVPGAIRLAWALLLASSLVALALYRLDWYAAPVVAALLMSYAVTAYFIGVAPRRRHDYFFTGLLDGLMLLQSAVVVLLAL